LVHQIVPALLDIENLNQFTGASPTNASNIKLEGTGLGNFSGSVTFTAGTGTASDTITRTDGQSWTAAGFQPGDEIEVSGDAATATAASNNGVYKITGISGANNNVLTLGSTGALTAKTATVSLTIGAAAIENPIGETRIITTYGNIISQPPAG